MAIRVRGYASAWNVVDAHGDVMEPGAFARSITSGRSVPLFWSHKGLGAFGSHPPIGRVIALAEDGRGLQFEAELLDTPRAEEVAAAIRSGATSEVSVAYSHEVAHRGEDGHSHITDLDLLEISIVQWGSNPQTSVELVPEAGAEVDADASPAPAQVLTEDQVLAAILAARS